MNLYSSDVTKAVDETRAELSPILRKLNYEVLSKYNRGYLKYKVDPGQFFIDVEIDRFLHSADYLNKNFPKTTKILDIGLFIPVLPIVLTKLGFQVETIEKLSLYGDALNPILDAVEKKYKFVVHNIDVIRDDISQFEKQYDMVLLMAILEHLNGSPRYLLETCKKMLVPSGSLMVEVPNVASLGKRLSFLLKGKPPFPDFQDYFWSEYPFEGHNREYSLKELQYALAAVGFDIYRIKCLNLRLAPATKIKTRLIKWLASMGSPSWRDVIWTISRIKHNE